ncbi:hypothetical protein ACQP2X_39420 [Actinoplanes sp. CA-131856]
MPADLHLQLRTAGSWDIPAVTALLTTGLEPARSTVPRQTPADRLAPRLQALLQTAIAAGSILVAEQDGRTVGALLWTTCGAGTPGPGPHPVLLERPGDARHHRVLDQQLTEHHPIAPHQHLLAVAVHTRRRRHGIASGLFTDWHRQADDVVLPSFLYAPAALTDTAGRHGYQPLGGPISVRLTAATLHPMWRPVHQAAPTEPDATQPWAWPELAHSTLHHPATPTDGIARNNAQRVDGNGVALAAVPA